MPQGDEVIYYNYSPDDPVHRRLLMQHLKRRRVRQTCQTLAEDDAARRRHDLLRHRHQQHQQHHQQPSLPPRPVVVAVNRQDNGNETMMRTRTSDVEMDVFCFKLPFSPAPSNTIQGDEKHQQDEEVIE